MRTLIVALLTTLLLPLACREQRKEEGSRINAYHISTQIEGSTVRWRIPIAFLQERHKQHLYWKIVSEFHQTYHNKLDELTLAAENRRPRVADFVDSLPRPTFEELYPLVKSVMQANEPRNLQIQLVNGQPQMKTTSEDDSLYMGWQAYLNLLNPSAYLFFIKGDVNIPQISAFLKPSPMVMMVIQPWYELVFDLERDELPTYINDNVIDSLPARNKAWGVEAQLFVVIEAGVKIKPGLLKGNRQGEKNTLNANAVFGGGMVYGPLEQPSDITGFAAGFGGDGKAKWLESIPKLGTFISRMNKGLQTNVPDENLKGAGLAFNILMKNHKHRPLLILTGGFAPVVRDDSWEGEFQLEWILPLDAAIEGVVKHIPNPFAGNPNMEELEKRLAELEGVNLDEIKEESTPTPPASTPEPEESPTEDVDEPSAQPAVKQDQPNPATANLHTRDLDPATQGEPL